MDKIIYTLLSVVMLLSLYSIFICFIDHLLSKYRESENFLKQISALKVKIFKSLFKVAKKYNILILIQDNDKMHLNGKFALGMFVYHINCDGKINLNAINHILMSEEWKFDPYVLGHELGHYFSIRYNNDTSEEAANTVCKKLVYNSLSLYQKVVYGKTIRDEMNLFLV